MHGCLSAIFCFFVAFEMVYPSIKGTPLRDKKIFNVAELIVRSSATWCVEDDRAFGTEQG